MYKKAAVIVFVVFVMNSVAYGRYSLGSCPDVEPVPRFNMNRFLGYWYSIQQTSPASCLSYNVTEDSATPEQYLFTEIEQHTPILKALHHEDRIRGKLTVPNPTEPGRMILDLPLDIGTINFIVFLTDYENYAAIFTCKKLFLAHSWSALILSRKPTLDMGFVDKVRTRLSSYNIDPFDLLIVDQSKCAPPGSQGKLIKAGSNILSNIRDNVVNLASK